MLSKQHRCIECKKKAEWYARHMWLCFDCLMKIFDPFKWVFKDKVNSDEAFSYYDKISASYQRQ